MKFPKSLCVTAFFAATILCFIACKNNAGSSAHEHKWGEGVVILEPTDDTPGLREFTCTCGEKRTEVIPELHKFSEEWTTNSTYHWREADCEFHHIKDKGEHDWDEGSVTTEPTDDYDGVKTYTCQTCGRTKTEAVPAKNHSHTINTTWMGDDNCHWQEASCGIESHNTPKNPHSWNTGTVIKTPTCTAKGEIVYECTDCKKTKKEELAMTEHAWNEGEVTKAATATDDGEKTFTCTDCGATKTEAIPATSHSHTIATEWSKDATHHWHAASCGTESHNKDKAEHTWNKGVTTTEPTCTETGVTTFTCTVCAATKTEPIAAKGHSFDTDWTSDANKHWHTATCDHNVKSAEGDHNWNSGVVTKEPTDTETGIKTYTCTTCKRKKLEVISLLTTGSGYYGLQFVSGDIELSYNQNTKTYTAAIDGAESLAFAWYFDGVKIAGQTGATLLETAFPAADVGYRELTVTTRKDGATYSAIYTVLVGHEHTIATTWSSNGTYHWHEASCGIWDHRADFAEHTAVNGTVKTAATCTKMGVTAYVCPDCGTSFEKTDIAKIDHAWDAGIVTDAATCKADGQKKFTCSGCGTTKTETIPASDAHHNWVITSQTPATIYESGTINYKCSVCNETKTETVKKLDHSHTMLTTWASDATNHWHEADCGNEGCREDLAAHNWVKDTTDNQISLCSVCGRIKESDKNKFTLTFVSGELYLSQSGNTVSVSMSNTIGDVTSYNWYLNGVKIAGQTGKTLDLTTLGISETGYYELTVTTRINGITYSAYYTIKLNKN